MTNQMQHHMYGTMGSRARRACAGGLLPLALVLTGLMMVIGTPGAAAKSLYAIAESLDPNQEVPILACDIAPDGTLTRQARRAIPLHGSGGVGLALDPQSQRLFVTYETSNVIELLDATTLVSVGTATAKNSTSLTGVVYDYDKKLLYCVGGRTENLYVYQWKPATDELVPVPDSPFRLEGAYAYGIALNETRGELYVGNYSTSVSVYSTSDWHLIRTISVSRTALAVAVDPVRNYLYYGGGLIDDYFLVRHDLTNDTEKEVRIGKLAGVVGVAVDPATGFVFTTTGSSTCYCGHELRVFNSNLDLLDMMPAIGVLGNPMGVVVPDGHVSYNPLRLTKTVKTSTGELTSGTNLPQVTVGEELTYSICFDHNDLPLTEVTVVDKLPAELSFVRATGDGVYGQYDAGKHTYTWSNIPLAGGPQKCLNLVCRVDPDTSAGRVITNSATIHTRETPPTTTEVDVVAVVVTKTYKPLHVTKTVFAGATGGGEATLPCAYAGDEITYRISFDNKDNADPVENVRLTDALPPGVDWVRATGDILFGRYDASTHTYTWSYPKLAAGDSNFVDLTVRLHDTVAAGSTLTNTAMIVSNETSVTRTSADIAVANFTPLRLQKTLISGAVGNPDDQGRSCVNAGSTLTYQLDVINPATNKMVTQVSLIDTLPRDVSFLSADSRDSGSYGTDPKTGAQTYTWRFVSLASGEEKRLILVVRVNDGVDPNTVIRNLATAGTAQTPTASASLDVVVRAAPVSPYTPLRLQKTLVQGAVGQPDNKGRPCVDPGSNLTYEIYFSNPATNRAVTQVSVVDTLPREVSLVRADGDRDFGFYDVDPKTGVQTYTWRFDSLAPGEEKRLTLVVRVNDKVDPNTVISNSATISTGQVASTQATAEVVIRRAPSIEGQMYVKPDHIYRNSAAGKPDLMVVVHLPEGIGMGALSNTPLVLTLDDVTATGQRVLNPANVTATGQMIFGSSTQGKVLCFFAVNPILAATQGYGEFPLRVTGRLNDGHSFYACGSIWIVKFGGP
jgi:uncharacterized repeat protein (TIGR01451 family)/fimbrial isopeptide formation D2 family protein